MKDAIEFYSRNFEYSNERRITAAIKRSVTLTATKKFIKNDDGNFIYNHNDGSTTNIVPSLKFCSCKKYADQGMNIFFCGIKIFLCKLQNFIYIKVYVHTWVKFAYLRILKSMVYKYKKNLKIEQEENNLMM